MSTRMPTLGFAALLLSPLCLTSQAIAQDDDRVDPARLIPADSTVAIHVDLAKMFDSRLGKRLISLGLKNVEDYDDIVDELGFDPLRELHSVTVYGEADELEDAEMTVVVMGSRKLKGAIDMVRQLAEFEEVDLDGVTALDTGGDGFLHFRDYGQDRIAMVLSDDEDRIVRGVKALRGRIDTIATADAPKLRLKPRRNSLISMVANIRGLDLEDIEPVSNVIKLARTLRLDFGESDDDVFLDLRIGTSDSEAAEAMSSMLDGVLALVRLTAMDELPKEMRTLMRGLDIEADGKDVRMLLTTRMREFLRMAGLEGDDAKDN